MSRGWTALDRLLRGDATRPEALRGGTLEIPAGRLAAVSIALGATYGVCMGCYALFREGRPDPLPMVGSAIKVPALFYLTLLVTFPSLYVFNALVGSRLGALSLLRLVVGSLAVMTAVLASLGPIVAFFSIMTTSYPFVLLLNVAVFAVSGWLGLSFLLQTLHRLSLAEPALPEPIEAEPVGEEKGGARPAGALERPDARRLRREVWVVFRCWVVLFGLVGAQMAWVLRPFIGNPDQPYTLFRPRRSNFFEAVWQAIGQLLG